MKGNALLDPFGKTKPIVQKRSKDLEAVRGARIVFWHDSTPEADVVYPVIKEYLEGLGAQEVALAKQPGPAYSPQERNLALVREADAAVIGVAW